MMRYCYLDIILVKHVPINKLPTNCKVRHCCSNSYLCSSVLKVEHYGFIGATPDFFSPSVVREKAVLFFHYIVKAEIFHQYIYIFKAF